MIALSYFKRAPYYNHVEQTASALGESPERIHEILETYYEILLKDIKSRPKPEKKD